MLNERKRQALAAAVLGLALAGAAVGGVVAASAAPRVQVVTVTEKEFKLVLSPAKVSAGKVTFVAVDRGKFPHALAIAGPGVKARTPKLVAGRSARLTVTLKAGTYTLWCPVDHHAQLGMRLTLHVGGASATVAANPAPAATTTTSSSGGGGGGGWG